MEVCILLITSKIQSIGPCKTPDTFRKFHRNSFIIFCVKLLTDKQADIQTDKQTNTQTPAKTVSPCENKKKTATDDGKFHNEIEEENETLEKLTWV